MRIHLPLHPHHFLIQPAAGPSSPPIFQLGGELVLIELQGELNWEGDEANGVIGVLGLDRPDKPTLHLGEHHLLHGKFTTLQKPYAVIRRATGPAQDGTELDGDASDEEEAVVEEDRPVKRKRTEKEDEDEDEPEPPLFEPELNLFPQTPSSKAPPASSSPFFPPSAPRDYSSDIDPSSPMRWDGDQFGVPDDDEEDEEAARHEEEMDRKRVKAREKRKCEEKERTRHYEVVGIVRKKVVFGLRPEPIVTATILPD